jgi:hypothetical protein
MVYSGSDVEGPVIEVHGVLVHRKKLWSYRDQATELSSELPTCQGTVSTDWKGYPSQSCMDVGHQRWMRCTRRRLVPSCTSTRRFVTCLLPEQVDHTCIASADSYTR